MNYLMTRIKVFVKVAFALFFLSIVEGFTADINLAWDPNSESNLAGYRIYYGPSSGNYTAAINLGNQTTYTVTGLAVGTYSFVVTAYNTLGMESDASTKSPPRWGSRVCHPLSPWRRHPDQDCYRELEWCFQSEYHRLDWPLQHGRSERRFLR